jgi:hypothetical protein
MQTLGDILTTCNILNTAFSEGRCDFCEKDGLTYTDPETGCLYCLPCLAGATDPDNQLEELPADPQAMAIAREVIAARRLAA